MRKIFLSFFCFLISLNPLLARDSDEGDTHRIMLIGAYEPSPNSNLSYLEGAKAEIDSIASIFSSYPVKKFAGKDATLENLISSKDFKPTIVHISSHGFENKEQTDYIIPLYSEEELFLSDDRKTINEKTVLSISKFKELFPTGIDLVILSANKSCTPEVIKSLIDANIKSCILSLWNVDDEATQIFMTEFYKNYLGGMSKQQSLQATQKTLRENSEYSAPEYWAAFILLDPLN